MSHYLDCQECALAQREISELQSENARLKSIIKRVNQTCLKLHNTKTIKEIIEILNEVKNETTTRNR